MLRLNPIGGVILALLASLRALPSAATLPPAMADCASTFAGQTNTTLRMPWEPEGKTPYELTNFCGDLQFDKPVKIASPPGDTNRLFVVERAGRIVVITNLSAPTRSIFLDLSPGVYAEWDHGQVEGLSSLAFHPGYLTNRFPLFFVTYTMRAHGPDGAENYNRLSRFQSSRANPNEASANTEVPLITQVDHGPGHNLNDLAFGPDGYLYAAAGDEGDGGTGDDFNNAQKIDKNFFSGILRLDVDGRVGNLPPNSHPARSGRYSIPADNPWVGATNFNGHSVDPANVRTEFYAVGLRNPWRIGFDPVTGALYEGDVGQHGREEINLIVKGGNYGWAYREGTLKGPKGVPPFQPDFIDPIYEYSPGVGPFQGFSVTGGMVYRGQALPELVGAYVFADYVSGNIWSFRCEGSTIYDLQRLATRKGIAGFGVDPRDGELLLIDHDKGLLLRLHPAPPSTAAAIPPTLAETGAFADLPTLTPNTGVVPYDVNHSFWSDGAEKKRWFALPAKDRAIGFSREGNWTFPAGTVWVKHFELTNAVPAPRRLETRLLVKSQDGVYGVTYRWGNSISNAVLLGENGLDEEILVQDGGIVRTQTWHYPSRSECITCHTPGGGFALGFNTAQLNRSVQLGGCVTNQIAAWHGAGYFSTVLSNFHTLPALAALDDHTVSREYRVRSYLAANCANCHQPEGSAFGHWDARVSTPLSAASIVNGPLNMTLGNTDNRVVKPGSLEQSILYTRIAKLGVFHMPPVATYRLNPEAIELVGQWILEDLTNSVTFQEWQLLNFGATNSPPAAAGADPDSDGASNYLEYLVGKDPLNPAETLDLQIHLVDEQVEISFPQVANRLFQVQFSDNLGLPSSWLPLDVLENRPFLSSSNRVGLVRDTFFDRGSRYYRLQVRSP